MKRFARWCLIVACLSAAASLMAPGCAASEADEILHATGIQAGLIVHLGCGDGKLTAALGTHERAVVHGLDADPAKVEKARTHIRSLGRYGRVSVDCCDGMHLPYVDNLVNLVVAEELGKVSMQEVMRVLAPLGVACVKQHGKWSKTAKPWPAGMDDWRQYLHDADNNAVAHDTVVGPPRHLQWVTDPAWSRSHMTIPTVVGMVSSQGRLFTIEDRATAEHPFLPGRFSLVARGAFNGIVLWSCPFPDWEPVTRYVKDIAVQLQRRMVAIGDTLYCTPGLDAPLTAFDAATGNVVRVYQGTERTQEVAYHEGLLYLVVGDRMNAARYNIVKTDPSRGISLGGWDPKAPFDGAGFRGAYGRETPDIDDPVCAVVAVEAASGKPSWKTENVHGYIACTLAIRGHSAVYQTNRGLMCFNCKTGSKVWSVDKPISSGDGTEANALILSDTTVYAQEGGALCAYSLQDGSPKWKGRITNNYEKSADLFLAAGALWTGGAAQPTSHDPETGKQISVIAQRMTGPMGHDRCYRNFITERYYINSKTGGADFVTLDGKAEFPHHYMRGTCGMGVLPCNGLLYVPPYSCQCSMGAMIKDMNALRTEKDLKSPSQEIRVERKARLVQGPAYASLATERSTGAPSDDWPTYRHDAARSGATPSRLPVKLTPRWKVELPGAASPPVVADGKVFVSEIHAHTVYALDASSGKRVWEYVAGSRVDSPPTFHQGLLLLGSRDGWVHCLRASDGLLAWRFKDLPDKMICAFGQLESAWPASGSVLVRDDVAYFAAGRSSFLDGGIFVYGLNPRTGNVIYQRQVYGPFDQKTGFPATGSGPFKSDIFVADKQLLYIRHRAFQPDLTDADAPRAHLIPSAGFLDGTPQHRTFWTIGTGYGVALGSKPSGDILATDGKDFYEVRGFPVKRHSYFDPRLSGYKLFAGTLNGVGESKAGRGKRAEAAADSPKAKGKWNSDIPLTGKAILLADDAVFVAGTPVRFLPDEPVAKYEAAYEGKLGGVLWVASAADGKKLAEYQLEAAPAWDGLAAAYGKLYLSLKNGTIVCFGEDQKESKLGVHR